MRIIKSTPISKNSNFSAGYSNGCSVTISHTKYADGVVDELHFHTKDSEYYYILSGEIEIEVNDQILNVEKGDCLEVLGGEKHKIKSLSEDAEYIVVRTNILPGDRKVVNE